jgi:KaiC/GvpD/RAD55 family RecA-like ATPase
MTGSSTIRTMPPSQRIVFHRLSALPPPPKREEIVRGLFATGEVVVIAGDPGCGKSAVAVALSIAVATGQPFLGRQVMQGSVAYIAAERHDEMRRRLDMAKGDRDPPVYLCRARPELAAVEQVDHVIAAIRRVSDEAKRPPALVVFDTLARCSAGLEENSSRDMSIVVNALTRITEEASTTVVVLHHTTKVSGTLRGSSALLGGVDLMLKVDGSTAVRQLRVDKANAVAEGQCLNFKLSAVATDDGDVVFAGPAEYAAIKRGSERQAKLVALMQELALADVTDKAAIRTEARKRAIYKGKPDATRIAFERDYQSLFVA